MKLYMSVIRRCHQNLKISFIDRWLDRLCCMEQDVAQSRAPTFIGCRNKDAKVKSVHTRIDKIKNEDI